MRKNKDEKLNPSKELEDFIEMVNFPSINQSLLQIDSKGYINVSFVDLTGSDLPGYDEDKGIDESKIPKSKLSAYEEAKKEAIKTIKHITKNSKSRKVYRNIFDNKSYFLYDKILSGVFEKYDAFINLRQNFLTIVSKCEWFYKTGYDLDYSNVKNPKNFRIDNLFNGFLTFNKDGTAYIQSDLINILGGNQPLVRLRKCLNCKNVIWAYQLNAKYCDEKCASAYNKRKTLNNPQKKKRINKMRRKNYAHKKKQELRRLENGNL